VRLWAMRIGGLLFEIGGLGFLQVDKPPAHMSAFFGALLCGGGVLLK